MKILHAANESSPVTRHSSLFTMPVMSAVNGKVIEGKFSIPFGMHPVEIVNEDGKKEKVVQRLTKDTAAALVAAFNSLRGRFARFISGPNIYRGHPDQANDPSPAAWEPLGKVVKMEATDNALVIHGDLPDASKALLAANESLAPSPYWGLRRTADKHEGLALCDPVAFFSLGITPRPNIAGAAANEAPAPVAPPATNEVPPPVPPTAANEVPANVGAPTEPVATPSHADRAQADRELAIAAANMAELETQIAAKDAELAALRAQLAAANALAAGNQKDLETARTQLLAETKLRETQATATLAACNALADAAVAAKLILPPDRDFWAKKIAETPAAANELLNHERVLKSKSVVDAARIAAANSALGGVSAAVRFDQVVRERMAKTHEQWPEAFNACKKSHAEIYNLMPNGGRG